jgi:hypothetical protein
MMRTLFRSVVAIAVAIFAARQAVFVGRDLVRYNGMRAMSGDAPLGGQTRRRAPTNAEARTTNPLVMLLSIPSDVVRYLKLKSM